MIEADTLALPLRKFPKKINAKCYNRGRLAILRIGQPLRIALEHHRGLKVILNNTIWLCVDSFADDQPVLAWREFRTQDRNQLHRPIVCELWLYHSCAGLIMGSALEDLQQTLEKLTLH